MSKQYRNEILEAYTLKVFNHGDPGLEKSDIVSEEWTKMKNILIELLDEEELFIGA